ncbi:UDP-N-acetylmuramate dehydrogenase [Gelidibacter algens]|uniref:UDP-N-acetylenolpyruvoylglucosamine reductase n=1 Tax=Gelidibacter algens TaxID=49280 RepID=A0A1A7R1U1_9FLAO|nr:UDP-N-acetylmuramate dehydrogenase [Gelidibacter algens]OBX25449.1 UDP-N-acetylenolpyruvoylglucosamine reductase [Gelidibacter algens]RAJ22340.1 UDP-N-acetylmuramate dehydrogenase [Gelidibacter algens]
MQIQKNISLKTYNTFGLDARAKYFIKVESLAELIEALSLDAYPDKFILGGGSNMLLTKDLDCLVIQVALKGIEIIDHQEDFVLVKANAGENWHEFVLWCLEHDFGGLENLSLIPGNVGTAPIQNIGAYGVEIKDVFVSCDALNIKTNKLETFTKEACQFGYRESIFKQAKKDQYIILDATFKLTKVEHQLHTEYGAIATELEAMGIVKPTIQDISKAVINIRESKLPNPKEIGNSGSFFKNPIISKSHYEKLKINFPEIPSYSISPSEVKIPAGWLIEKSGFKGKTFDQYGVHKKQALVLVNYGNAKGSDILNLAKLIQKTIQQIFGITIEMEVNII